jgi:hypothetical protein
MIEPLFAVFFTEEKRTILAQLLKPVAYFLAALPLFHLSTSRAVVHGIDACVRKIWFLLGGLYMFVAANALVQGDALFIHWLRQIFKENNWYEYRRVAQIVLLSTLIFGLGAWVFRKPGLGQEATQFSVARTLLLASAAGTTGVYILKFISFHYTDILLNTLWLNHSTAIWIELAALGLAGLGTGVALKEGRGHV